MTNAAQTVLGIAATVALAIVDELLPDGGLTFLLIVALLASVSAIRGLRLPLFVRLFATGATFYLGYGMCLVGRTMGPRLSEYTVQMALVMFGHFASLPTLALLRIWQGRLRVIIIAFLFPISLASAAAVAAYEEHTFIQQHPQGVGPTAGGQSPIIGLLTTRRQNTFQVLIKRGRLAHG